MVASIHGNALAQDSGEQGQRDVLADMRLGHRQTLHDDLRAGDVRPQLLGSRFDVTFEVGPATVPVACGSWGASSWAWVSPRVSRGVTVVTAASKRASGSVRVCIGVSRSGGLRV